MNGHLMASCARIICRIICTTNFQQLVVGFQVTVENVRDAFLGDTV